MLWCALTWYSMNLHVSLLLHVSMLQYELTCYSMNLHVSLLLHVTCYSMHLHVTVCNHVSLLRCYSMNLHVTVCTYMLQNALTCHSMYLHVIVCTYMLQYALTCHSMYLHVIVCTYVMVCTYMLQYYSMHLHVTVCIYMFTVWQQFMGHILTMGLAGMIGVGMAVFCFCLIMCVIFSCCCSMCCCCDDHNHQAECDYRHRTVVDNGVHRQVVIHSVWLLSPNNYCWNKVSGLNLALFPTNKLVCQSANHFILAFCQ